MDQTKKKQRKFFLNKYLVLSITFLLAVFLGLYSYTYFSYRNSLQAFSLSSPIAPLLHVFAYNKSQHPDPVAGCWYDSGDYVVFIQRNTQSLFYLSQAYHYAKNPDIKQDLRTIIDDQLVCINTMLEKNYKQFRDQSSHGINLPPFLHQLFYPQHYYPFETGEGKDIHLLLSLIYQNLGDENKAAYHRTTAQSLSLPTISSHCCEEGPLRISDQEMHALEILNKQPQQVPLEIWGSSFGIFASFSQANYRSISNVLHELITSPNPTSTFNYIGSNYDIAGFISTIQLYTSYTSDKTYLPLATTFMNYLHGNNPEHLNFTTYHAPYHPCYFFSVCSLPNTLINGFDEQKTFKKKRFDLWRLTEVQLLGQAEYILSYVLYNDL